MSIFGLFWSYLFYFVVFSTFYFSVEKLFLWEKFQKPSRSGLVEDFIFGTIIGTITLLCQLIISVINVKLYLPLFISSAILITIFKNYIKALITFIPGFINYLFVSYEGNEIYLAISFSLAMILLIHYVKIFLFEKYLPLAYFLLLGTWFITTMLIASFELYANDIEKALSKVALIYLLTIISYLLMWYLINFVKSSRVLHDTSRYQFLNFFRPSLAIKSINDFLITKKVQYGYLVLFRLKYSKDYAKHIKDRTNVDIENHFYKLLQDQVINKGVLFNYGNNENGFFIPTSKMNLKNKKLSLDFKRIIRIFNSRHIWDPDEIPLKVATNFGIARYGIDSQSVSKLLSYATFALNDQAPSNHNVAFFNWIIYQSYIFDDYWVNSMDKTFQLDNLSKTFTPLYDVLTKKHFATYTSVWNLSNSPTYETMRENIYIKNFQNIFDRYYASDFLLESQKQKVLIHYAPTIFENKFLLARFIDFFERNKIEFNRTYLVFDNRGLNYVQNHKIIKKNVLELTKKGIKFVIPCYYSKLKISKILNNVDYTFVEVANFQKFKNNYPQAKLICFDLATPQQVLTAFKNKVQVFGGPLFNQEFNFLKFSKQSKIYLENIIKEVNSE